MKKRIPVLHQRKRSISNGNSLLLMTETSPNARLETFCDGVLAIAITLLIIDLKIPATPEIRSTADFWLALARIVPSASAFVLSFIIIFITWVNQYNVFKLVDKTSIAFVYANGFVLLTVVFIPFPTSLVGEFILTDHAGPAVFLYNLVIAIHGVAWISFTHVALKYRLMKSESSRVQMRLNQKHAYFAFVLYSLLAIIALWFPLTIAAITTFSLLFWLAFGVKMQNG